MPADRYDVSASLAARERFRHAIEKARVAGQFDVAVQAAKWIREELARTPLEFGESREVLPAMQLQVRVAFVRPLGVKFGVHEVEKKVFITSFMYCGNE